jgi:diadenylate cyclase
MTSYSALNFISANWLDWARLVIDVIVVAYLIYRALLVIRGTRAAPMLAGLSLIALLYFLSKYLGLSTLGWILGNFLSSIILVVVVLFQDEIRRGLTKVGTRPLFGRSAKTIYDKTIEDITIVCSRFSERRIGALMVIQREVGLEEFVEEAVILDALLTRKLLFAIFLKDSPMHDGAVIIDGDRVKVAGAVLPLSFNPDLDPNLGTRHRAALGLSERSDAVIIVVSEENGSIALARDGRLIMNLDASTLRDSLHRFISTRSALAEETEDL